MAGTGQGGDLPRRGRTKTVTYLYQDGDLCMTKTVTYLYQDGDLCMTRKVTYLYQDGDLLIPRRGPVYDQEGDLLIPRRWPTYTKTGTCVWPGRWPTYTKTGTCVWPGRWPTYTKTGTCVWPGRWPTYTKTGICVWPGRWPMQRWLLIIASLPTLISRTVIDIHFFSIRSLTFNFLIPIISIRFWRTALIEYFHMFHTIFEARILRFSQCKDDEGFLNTYWLNTWVSPQDSF